VRDLDHPTARALAGLTQGPCTTLITVKYDAGSEQSAVDAVAKLRTEHGIDHLDIVVANAGISKQWPLVKDVKLADIREHVDVNVLGVVSLYQATRDLLQKSRANPIFAPMGSMAGSLG
jgi:norsolorinic acid ketoreductase